MYTKMYIQGENIQAWSRSFGGRRLFCCYSKPPGHQNLWAHGGTLSQSDPRPACILPQCSPSRAEATGLRRVGRCRVGVVGLSAEPPRLTARRKGLCPESRLSARFPARLFPSFLHPAFPGDAEGMAASAGCRRAANHLQPLGGDTAECGHQHHSSGAGLCNLRHPLPGMDGLVPWPPRGPPDGTEASLSGWPPVPWPGSEVWTSTQGLPSLRWSTRPRV